MLNVKQLDVRWDESLKPRTDKGDWPEEFAPWWERNGRLLANLHPSIAEQWLHRHWSSSHFRFLELRELSWRKETWSTADVLDRVYMVHGGPMNPEFDYQAMRERSDGPTLTARNWHDGTWDTPLLAMETPDGIDGYEGPLPNIRFMLIEGSKRMRYLNALHARGEATGPHQLYILSKRR